jgi:tetratricopeptide (TPR) repeat protein
MIGRFIARAAVLAALMFVLCGYTEGTVEYYIAVAEKFVVLGMPDKTAAYYAKAIATDPRSPLPYRSRAFLRLRQGQKDAAIADFTRAIDLAPHVPDDYLSRGLAYSDAGEKEKADADFRRACELGDKSGCLFLRSGGGGE